jgi:hypothetical protein
MQLRDERRILEEHARVGGCSLILNPFQDFSAVGARVHRSQLEVLRQFLTSMPEDMITVAVADGSFAGNLTIVGDWFGAKALPAQSGSGYRQTVFSTHASTVLRWTRDFDEELEDGLRAKGIGVHGSCDHALKRIDDRLRELPAE